MSMRIAACLLACLAGLADAGAQVPLPPGQTTQASMSSAGVAGDDDSIGAAVSADGRYVAFESIATNLVLDDTNGIRDIFVHDRLLGLTTRVSVATDGTESNDISFQTAISGDGRYVAFTSFASNLVVPDDNLQSDIIVHDRELGVTEAVTVTPGGLTGDSDSGHPALSHDGRYVAFMSRSSDLVAGDTNGARDVFVRDRLSGTTTRVSVSTAGVEGDDTSNDPAISPDGRFVAFYSSATNLVADDTNGVSDAFLHDTLLGTTELVSRASDGTLGNGATLVASLSSDGRYIAFYSHATNFVAGDLNGVPDAYLKDRDTGAVELISVAMSGFAGNAPTDFTLVSEDGRFVCFGSRASDLVPGPADGPADHEEEHDVFVRDRLLGTTSLVSVSSAGAEGDSGSISPEMNPDASVIVFDTYATDLFPGDLNGATDIAVHDRNPWTDVGGGLAGASGIPTLAGSGLLIPWTSGELTLDSAAPSELAYLFVSAGSSPARFKGGEILAFPALFILPMSTDGAGSIDLSFTWQPGLPSGTELWFQFLVQDAGAPLGVAISTAVAAITP